VATRTPQQVRDYIGYKGYSYQPEGNFYLPEQANPTFQPGGFFLTDDESTLFSAEDIARQYNIPISELTAALPLFETAPSYAQSSSRGGGFFSHLIGLVTSPSFGLAASVIAPSIFAAEAAGAAAAAPGATSAANTGAGLIDASLGQAYADLGVGAGAPAAAAAAPVAVATPVPTSPLATMGGPNILMDFPANMIDASLGQSYNALGVGAGVPAAAAGANALTMADLAAADASAGLLGSSSALAPAASAGVGSSLADALANVVSPGGGIDASIGQAYSDLGVGSGLGLGTAANTLANVVSPGEGIDASIGKAYADLGVEATGLPTDLLSSLAKFAKDYGVPLSLLTSAITGSRAATDAANIQAESAREARALAEKIFNEQKALQEPYRAAGITAQNQLLNLLGLSGNTAASEYGKFARPFGMSDFQQDPGYAFRLSEGMKALEASRAAKGGLLSGATGKALQRYGQEMGSQEYGNAFNRFQTERANRLNPLAGLTASGQAAAAGQAANAGNYATTAGNLTTDIGAAQAAGGIGSANAITNALNQFARYSAGQNLANQIRSSVYAPVIG
jgi:hypothetical protein